VNNVVLPYSGLGLGLTSHLCDCIYRIGGRDVVVELPQHHAMQVLWPSLFRFRGSPGALLGGPQHEEGLGEHHLPCAQHASPPGVTVEPAEQSRVQLSAVREPRPGTEQQK